MCCLTSTYSLDLLPLTIHSQMLFSQHLQLTDIPSSHAAPAQRGDGHVIAHLACLISPRHFSSTLTLDRDIPAHSIIPVLSFFLDDFPPQPNTLLGLDHCQQKTLSRVGHDTRGHRISVSIPCIRSSTVSRLEVLANSTRVECAASPPTKFTPSC